MWDRRFVTIRCSVRSSVNYHHYYYYHGETVPKNLSGISQLKADTGLK